MKLSAAQPRAEVEAADTLLNRPMSKTPMTHPVLDSPVFVVGALRSGTTLLRLMLRHHPNITCGEEFEYGFGFIEADHPPPVERYRQSLARDRSFADAKLTIDESLDYAELVRSFLAQRFDADPAHAICAVVHSRFDCIPMVWPRAKYIHLVRDPRDVARSCIGMGWCANVFYGAHVWIDAERRWDRLLPQLAPDQWIDVRYEKLVEEPEAVLRQLCAFIGVGYSPSVFDYSDHSTYDPPDPSLARQWETKLTDEQIGWVEVQCVQLMKSRGYERATLTESISPFIRLWLWVDNRMGRVRFNIKRYGIFLYLKWQWAKRLASAESTWAHGVIMQINDIQRQHFK